MIRKQQAPRRPEGHPGKRKAPKAKAKLNPMQLLSLQQQSNVMGGDSRS